jgi:transcription elongation factor Elf1
MAGSLWTIEHFTCPNCGMEYAATKEQHSDKRTGSFKCKVCQTEVHAWSGFHDFFDWKAAKTQSPPFGKKK